MLAFAEVYLARIHQAAVDDDIIAIIGGLAAELGYRSGYLISYGAEFETAMMVLDSNWARSSWWSEYLESGLRDSAARAREVLFNGAVQHLDATRFGDRRDRMAIFAGKVDMVDTTVVPINFDTDVLGLVGFSGEQLLSVEQQHTLLLVSYALFAKARSFHASGIRVAPAGLTPREREVMLLSAEGLTSKEVADRLGMSPRTANQHLDNVADKLGTKNRVHTVAKAIRKSLL